MRSSATPFPSEAHLVDALVAQLAAGSSAWGDVALATEWNYGAGFTDVLVHSASGLLIAFEAKLTDWKGAFYQAYRNTSFADLAYVVMPHAKARAVCAHSLFTAKGVGVCGLGPDGLTVFVEALPGRLLLPRVRRHALTSLAGGVLDAGTRARSGRYVSRKGASAHA